MDEEREKVLLIYQKSGSLDKASKSRVMQLEVEISGILGKIIEEGMQKGVFKNIDVDLMAYNIMMMGYMWILKRWHFKHRLNLDQFIDLQLETILNALKRE